jgi:Type II secretion system (T2SS), protein E, N-terminal domain
MLLGERLVHEQRLGPHELDVALRAQVIYGGRLGTNLVELGQIDLDALTLALAEQTGVPAALQQHFEQVDPQVIGLIPPALAERHHAVPLGLATLQGRQLVVAFMDPHKPIALDEIGEVTRARVTPCVAPELRLHFYLEHFYGVRRRNRFLRIAVPDVSGSRPRPSGAIGYMAERRRYLGADEETPWPTAAFEGTGPPPAAPPLPERPALTLDQAVEAVHAAATRDDIGDAIVDHLRSRYGCGAVLVDRDGLALGWKGFSPGVDATTIEAIALPLSAPSALGLAHEGRGLFRGSPPTDGPAGVQGRLWKLLRVPPPSEVVVAPVVLNGRVVCLLLALPPTGGTLPEGASGDLAVLAAAAAASFVRLIQIAKRA